MRQIYVAGSSDELERVERCMAAARAAGLLVTFDWALKIREVGAANPRDVSVEQRREWALADLEGVEAADVVWFLAPEHGPARGAFYEIAHANAIGLQVVVSGKNHACSIFTALCAAECETDEEGLGLILRMLGAS